MEDIDKEISEMKLMVNARARICAQQFLAIVSERRAILFLSYHRIYSNDLYVYVHMLTICMFVCLRPTSNI